MKTNFTKKIEAELQKLRPALNQKFFGENYIGGGQSRLIYLNLKIPDVRTFFSEAQLIDQKISEIEKLWVQSNIFEAKCLALIWLEKKSTYFLLKNLKKILSWANEIDNWALSDAYCGSLARAFEADPKKILPTYFKWNKNKNPWLRRISMVGLFYYSRFRKTQPSFQLAISLIQPHLLANEYYVQKAVGWTLRECYNVYKKQTTAFITQNTELIHSAAWFATTEKMPLVLKKKLVLKRRMSRKKAKK